MTIKALTELPEDFHLLETESKSEGFNFLVKMKTEWASGKNRFDKPGEKVFGIFDQDKLVAIGGINIDPYAGDTSIGRVRHLYVLRNHRRQQLGAKLIAEIVRFGAQNFTKLRLRTDTVAAAEFYEKLGFKTVDDSSASHEWVFNHRL